MSTDSSKPFSRSSSSQRPPNHKASITIQTVLIGLLLYIVPPVIASVWIGLTVALIGVSSVDATHWLENAASAQFVYVLITEVLVMAAIVWLLRVTEETWRSIGVRKPKFSHIAYTLGGFVSYYAIYIVVAAIVSQIFALNFNQRQEIGFSTDSTGVNVAFAFAALVILPPIVEEILFRGFLYTRFRKALSIKWAAVAASLLFAAAHLQFGSGNALLWVAALDTFILSLVLVYLREKTGNIWAGAGVHALKNLLAFLILFHIVQ